MEAVVVAGSSTGAAGLGDEVEDARAAVIEVGGVDEEQAAFLLAIGGYAGSSPLVTLALQLRAPSPGHLGEGEVVGHESRVARRGLTQSLRGLR